MRRHREVIELWPTRAEFARELGVAYQTARQWYARDNIPANYWPGVVSSAAARGLRQVTVELLLAIKAECTPAAERRASSEGWSGRQGEFALQVAE
jgi:hypothetical protein